MPRWDSCWHRGTSSRQFRWVGIARGGSIDAAERFSLANTIAEEVVDFPGKEEGHFEDRGLNLTEFVRHPSFTPIDKALIAHISSRRRLYERSTSTSCNLDHNCYYCNYPGSTFKPFLCYVPVPYCTTKANEIIVAPMCIRVRVRTMNRQKFRPAQPEGRSGTGKY